MKWEELVKPRKKCCSTKNIALYDNSGSSMLSSDFITKFKELLDTVPEDQKTTSVVDSYTDSEYDCTYIYIEYQVDETDEDIRERINNEVIRANGKYVHDIAMYNKFKEIYG